MREPFDLTRPPTPAERIPSHGTQLSADRSADITNTGLRIDNRTVRDLLDARADAGDPLARSHGFGTDARPVALNLWDTSPDSLPETWSTPR